MSLESEAAEFWGEEKPGLSHWYAARPDRWHHIARRTRREVMRHFTHIRVAVEWGPGGGANVVALHGIADTIYGVDISQANLDECSRQARGQDFRPILIDVLEPEAVLTVLPRADLFVCISVIQHLPSKGYAKRILQISHDLLRPGGLAIFQVKPGEGAKAETYAEAALSMVCWQPSEFEAALEAVRFRIVDYKPRGYYVVKRH